MRRTRHPTSYHLDKSLGLLEERLVPAPFKEVQRGVGQRADDAVPHRVGRYVVISPVREQNRHSKRLHVVGHVPCGRQRTEHVLEEFRLEFSLGEQGNRIETRVEKAQRRLGKDRLRRRCARGELRVVVLQDGLALLGSICLEERDSRLD